MQKPPRGQLDQNKLMTRATKRTLDFFCALAVLPAVCTYRFAVYLVGDERAFPGWSQLFSLIPGLSGVYLRRAFYRFVLPACGSDVCISFGTVFSHSTARIGNRVYIGVGCMVGDATLEDDVLIGSHVSVINGRRQHGIERLDIPIREQPGEYPRIQIGVDSWIGDGAVVSADVGRHAVVGAGAVVTKPVPELAIVAGNPARVIASRSELAASSGEHSHDFSPATFGSGTAPPQASVSTIGVAGE